MCVVLCLQPCPSPSVSFKQHQCSQFNSKAFGRRYYQWIPLYPGKLQSVSLFVMWCHSNKYIFKYLISCVADYISISNKPCDLQCTTMSGERQLLVPAHDGTFCRDTKYHGVCIEGKCQVTQHGKDGILFFWITTMNDVVFTLIIANDSWLDEWIL